MKKVCKIGEYELVGMTIDDILVLESNNTFKCYHPNTLTRNVILTITDLDNWISLLFIKNTKSLQIIGDLEAYAVNYLYFKARELPKVVISKLPGLTYQMR